MDEETYGRQNPGSDRIPGVSPDIVLPSRSTKGFTAFKGNQIWSDAMIRKYALHPALVEIVTVNVVCVRQEVVTALREIRAHDSNS